MNFHFQEVKETTEPKIINFKIKPIYKEVPKEAPKEIPKEPNKEVKLRKQN